MLRIALCVAAMVVVPLFARAANPADVERYYSKTYNDCMTEANGSTLPMRDCKQTEHDAWDKQLNQVYQALIAARSGAAKAQLRDDERAWIKRTAHTCDHAGDDEQGGSLQGVEIDQCYLDETIARTVYLRGLLNRGRRRSAATQRLTRPAASGMPLRHVRPTADQTAS